MKRKGWHPEKNPSWKEPLQKSQFLTENSFTMSHFRPTSRGENLGEHLDVFRPLPCFGGSLRQMSSVYVTSCFPWDDVIRFFLPHVKIQVGRSLSKSLNSLQKILLQWPTSDQLQGERTWKSTWMSSGLHLASKGPSVKNKNATWEKSL